MCSCSYISTIVRFMQVYLSPKFLEAVYYMVMDQIQKSLHRLQQALQGVWATLELDSMQDKLAGLQAQMLEPDFWSDSAAAQGVSKEEARLKTRLEPWLQLQKDIYE